MSDGYLSPSRLEEERERVIAALSTHFAHDNLDTAEFEARLDHAYRAVTLAELKTLQSDLPALPEEPTVPTSGAALARAEDVRDRQFVISIMGGTERKGLWTPARSVEVIAVMGGVGLDFREARFAPGVTQVNVLAIMGGVEIIVPPGVRVESTGFGIMGGFEGMDQPGLDHSDAPVLRITGLALMGGVEVTERLPGESGREASKRRKEERKRLADDARHRRRLGEGG